jgi:hypothetical protein
VIFVDHSGGSIRELEKIFLNQMDNILAFDKIFKALSGN